MARALTMPKLGLSMVEGTVSHWLVAEGGEVVEGEPVVVVETAKISYEVESPISGTLRRILREAGDAAPVGGTIGVLGEADEQIDFSAFEVDNAVPVAALPGGFDPSTTRLGREAKAAPPVAALAAAVGQPITPAADLAPDVPDGSSNGIRLLASPAARRRAAETGLDLSRITGSGPRGRIQLGDVEAALSTPGVAPHVAPAAAAGPEPDPLPVGVRRAPTRASIRGTMRPVIARNMEHSKRTAAHATISLKANATALVELRRELLASVAADDVRITYTDIFLKIVGRTLLKSPMLRSYIDGDDLVTLNDIDISLAVHLSEAGLIVPVIRDCDRLTLQEIAHERTRLMELGRSGRLGPDDSAGGCFTITNMGAVYALDSGTPIINPPQSAILGIGSIRDEVVPVDGAPGVAPMVNLFMSIDHRVVDGEPAVRFLNQVCGVIENPTLGLAQF
jgi:pyruvate dehydrogenase E2 component (dihydrolipoamide acetyltransferase)